MGQTHGCCAEDSNDAPKEVAEAVEACNKDWDSPVSSAASQLEDDAPAAAEGGVAAAQAPSKWSRVDKMGHLEVDTEILRGISLRTSLRRGGKLWRQSPIDLEEKDRAGLWNLSEPVKEFDVFLSHTWQTPGRWKVLTLLFQSGLRFTLLCTVISVIAAVVLSMWRVVPMPFTFVPQAKPGPVCAEECPYAPWPSVAGLLGTLFGLFFAPYFVDSCDKTICFLDVVSIHQVDTDLMERGIYGLGGFLRVSKELRVLWSEPYLSRLWCVFELAAYRNANPEGRIQLTPVFLEVGMLSLILASYFAAFLFFTVFAAKLVFQWRLGAFVIALLPVYILMHAMRLNTRAKHRLLSDLKGFDLSQASCRTDFDKDFIYSAIVEWYGSTEAFTEYVRGPLREEMLGVEEFQFPVQYLLLAAASPVSSSLNTALALWVGGAPAQLVGLELVSFTLAFYFFYFLPLLKFSIHLCDRFAAPRWPGCFMDYVQTLLIFLCFFGLYYAGDFVATAALQGGWPGSIAWLLFAMLLAWTSCFGGWELIRSFTKSRVTT